MGTVANIKIEPMDVYVGEDKPQIQTVSCVESTASASLNSKYFLLYDQAGGRYAVWIDVNNTGAAPSIGAGYTEVEVDIAANPVSADAVATAVAAAIDALGAFSAVASGKVVTVTAAANGYAVFAHDAQASAGKTGFAFAVSQVGDAFEQVGFIDGDIEVGSLSRSPVDITAHQTGATILGQILTGAGNPELSFSLKEVTKVNYQKVLRYSSGEVLPVAPSSTSGMGGGSLGQFKSPQLVRIVFHPTRLGLADKTQDYCFWKCVVDLDSVTFSGESILTLPVSARAFEDGSKADGVDVWMFGDWSQNFANS